MNGFATRSLLQYASALLLVMAVTACDSRLPNGTQSPVGVGGSPPITGDSTAPVAVPDVAVVQLNSDQNLINVLANDLDSNGDALKITAAEFTLSAPPTSGGSLAIAADGLTLRYTPPTGFVGSQTLRYSISDSRGGTATTLAVITVSPLPIPPVAVTDAFTLMTNSPAVALNVLANDLDGAGGGLMLVSAASTVSNPSGNGGTISIVSNHLQYQPKPGFSGVDTLLYTLRDANGATASANVLITVLPLAAPPVAVADVMTIAADTIVNIDVLANDIDLAGGGLTLTTVNAVTSLPPGTNGGFTVIGNRVRYTPPSASFIGTQTASYTVTDSNGQMATAAITVIVTPSVPPPPPIAVPDTALLMSGTTAASINVLANDIDTAGGGLTITAVSVAESAPMTAGAIASTNGSAVLLTVPTSYVGILTLTYSVSDANGSTANTAVIVTVQPAALPPVPPLPIPDVATVAQDSPSTSINVIANDIDPAGGGLTLVTATISNSVPAGQHSLTVTGNQLQFAPASGFAGIVTVAYTIRDANGSTANSGVLTIVVTPTPVTVPPVLIPDVATVSSGAGATNINVLANDIDAVGGGLTLTAASLTAANPMAAGTIDINANQVRYIPTLAYVGLVTVSYSVIDSIGQTATTGTLVITVVP